MFGGLALAGYTQRADQPDGQFRLAMSGVIAGIGVALILLGPARETRVDGGRDDWARGFARSDTQSQARTKGLAGVVCLLMSVPIAFQLPEELSRQSNYLALVALVFPIVGLFLASGAA